MSVVVLFRIFVAGIRLGLSEYRSIGQLLTLGRWNLVSPLSLVKNPMILMAIVALVLTLGMPKLMENSTCIDLLTLAESCL